VLANKLKALKVDFKK
jgi:hypothetical protein